LVFSPEEAAAIALGANLMERLWGRLYREACQSALAKLENVLPDEQRQEIAWAQRSLAATGLSRDDIERLAPTLHTLRQALREGRRVRMAYHSYANPAGQERQVDPYGLAHATGWWYLVGYCHLRQDLRIFRVDRIAGLELTAERCRVPEDFDLHAYVAQMQQAAPQVQVRMRFLAQFAGLAQIGRGYWDEMAEQADGSVVVTFRSPDVTAAASNVLAYGAAVEVLEPPEVRRTVQQWAQATANLYQQKED
jgi:predicted DNA-binding transcriptional regulator YafY